MRILKGVLDKWRQRTAYLYWPVETLRERVIATRDQNLFTRAEVNTNYPFRAIRYWWIGCAISDEARRLGRPLTILDVGCGKGKLRSFVGKTVPGRWIGIDWTVDAPGLARVGYDEVYECNLDQSLPLPDQLVDIIVFIHVIEHLPRPSFTMAELSRILRPGGVLLGGCPVAPAWIALIRQWQHQRQLRLGRRKPGDHIHSFCPARWRHLLQTERFTLELMNGVFFCRSAGSPLENWRWWLRVNQIWGALFPSLGSELYLMARKSEITPLKNHSSPTSNVRNSGFRPPR